MFTTPLALLTLATAANAYWLMGVENFITTERIDPVVMPGRVSSHVHSVLGGSNFRMSVSTSALRQSSCTSIPIPQDMSNYWFPHLYFQWRNGSFTSLNGGAVIYYLYSDKPGVTTAFPDDFRMITGDMTLRTYDPKSIPQQAVSFLCLDFNGVTTRHPNLPNKQCPSGIRSQINFPSCWDGKRTDSPDHKSHVAFPSGGPDSGTCSDPKHPVTIPRIFLEVYWESHSFDSMRNQAMNPNQPFAFSHGDPTGYGYHADFINGWEPGVLQRAVDKCHCSPYGDPTCCVNQGIFSMNKGKTCRITNAIDEQTTGTLPKLPGNNPIVPEGKIAMAMADTSSPPLLSPIFAYTGASPTATGTVVGGAGNQAPTLSPTTVPESKSTSTTSIAVVPPSSSSAAAATTTTRLEASSAAPPAVRPTRPTRPRADVPVADTNADVRKGDAAAEGKTVIETCATTKNPKRGRRHNRNKFGHSH